jgi:hypothetical protein
MFSKKHELEYKPTSCCKNSRSNNGVITMCQKLNIYIKNFADIDNPYLLSISKDECDKDILSLYFLLKKAYIKELDQKHIGKLSEKLIMFDKNFYIANDHAAITSHNQVFMFDDKGGVHVQQKQDRKPKAITEWFKRIIKRIKKCE